MAAPGIPGDPGVWTPLSERLAEVKAAKMTAMSKLSTRYEAAKMRGMKKRIESGPTAR